MTLRGPDFSPRETKRRTASYRDAGAAIVELGILHTLSLVRDHSGSRRGYFRLPFTWGGRVRGGEVYPRGAGDARRNGDSSARRSFASNGKRLAHFGKTRLASPTPTRVCSRTRDNSLTGARGSGYDQTEGRSSSGRTLTEVGMSQQPGADVIVAADRDPTAVERCLQNLLAHGGPHLRRLIVVDDDSADPDMPEMLERLADDRSQAPRRAQLTLDWQESVRTTAGSRNARVTPCS